MATAIVVDGRPTQPRDRDRLAAGRAAFSRPRSTAPSRSSRSSATASACGSRAAAACSMLKVLPPRAAELLALMPAKAAADLSQLLLSPMPGLLVSLAVSEGPGGQGRRGAGRDRGDEDGERAARRARRHGRQDLCAKPGDSLAVDQVILEFADAMAGSQLRDRSSRAACRASAIAPGRCARRGARGLRGWVRNRRDGSVEALLIGAAGDVAAMIAACRRGPPLARVDRSRERCRRRTTARAGFYERADGLMRIMATPSFGFCSEPPACCRCSSRSSSAR